MHAYKKNMASDHFFIDFHYEEFVRSYFRRMMRNIQRKH